MYILTPGQPPTEVKNNSVSESIDKLTAIILGNRDAANKEAMTAEQSRANKALEDKNKFEAMIRLENQAKALSSKLVDDDAYNRSKAYGSIYKTMLGIGIRNNAIAQLETSKVLDAQNKQDWKAYLDNNNAVDLENVNKMLSTFPESVREKVREEIRMQAERDAVPMFDQIATAKIDGKDYLDFADQPFSQETISILSKNPEYNKTASLLTNSFVGSVPYYESFVRNVLMSQYEKDFMERMSKKFYLGGLE